MSYVYDGLKRVAFPANGRGCYGVEIELQDGGCAKGYVQKVSKGWSASVAIYTAGNRSVGRVRLEPVQLLEDAKNGIARLVSESLEVAA